MKKQITIYVSTKYNDGVSYTEVSTYKEKLAHIYYLEEKDGFKYCIHWMNGYWCGDEFDNEIDAVRYACMEYDIPLKYEVIRLKMNDYTNTENGFMKYEEWNLKDINI